MTKKIHKNCFVLKEVWGLSAYDISTSRATWRSSRDVGEVKMPNTPGAAHSPDSRRFKLTSDVHLLLLNDNGKILFGHRQNTGFEDGAYHLPSGHLEPGESVTQALIRETREEVGVTVAPEHVEFSHVMHNSSSGGRVAFFFTVRQWQGSPENCEPDKCSELRWFSLSALPAHMIDYCRVALDHIGAGRPFSTFGW